MKYTCVQCGFASDPHGCVSYTKTICTYARACTRRHKHTFKHMQVDISAFDGTSPQADTGCTHARTLARMHARTHPPTHPPTHPRAHTNTTPTRELARGSSLPLPKPFHPNPKSYKQAAPTHELARGILWPPRLRLHRAPPDSQGGRGLARGGGKEGGGREILGRCV
jgi:hypothetical protein